MGGGWGVEGVKHHLEWLLDYLRIVVSAKSSLFHYNSIYLSILIFPFLKGTVTRRTTSIKAKL